MNTKYDCIVIGSGPGGCTAAKELAKKGKTVLILEKGNSKGNIEDFSLKEMRENYRYGGVSFTVGNSLIKFVEGQVAGGGSSVNSGLYHRIPENILKNWRVKENFNIDDKEILKIYSEIESDLGVEYWPKHINYPKSSNTILEGAKNLEWNCMEVPRWFEFIDGTFKRNSSLKLIEKELKSGKIKMILNSEVIKYKKSKNLHQLTTLGGEHYSCQYLFCAMGNFATFNFIKKNFKIKSKGDFTIHPTCKILAEFPFSMKSEIDVGIHQVKEFSPEISIGCSASGDFQVNLNRKLYQVPESVDNDKLAIYYSMLSTKTRGRIIKIPLIKDTIPLFFLSKNDYSDLHMGVTKMCKLLFSQNCRKIYFLNQDGSSFSIKNLGELEMMKIKKIDLMSIHVMSSLGLNTTRLINKSKGNLVIDDTVYVVDSSILPSSPSVNPQGAVMFYSKLITSKIKI